MTDIELMHSASLCLLCLYAILAGLFLALVAYPRAAACIDVKRLKRQVTVDDEEQE